jgi:hypothetical protein
MKNRNANAFAICASAICVQARAHNLALYIVNLLSLRERIFTAKKTTFDEELRGAQVLFVMNYFTLFYVITLIRRN